MVALPLALPRVITLALATAFGVIGGSVGVNSIVKRNQAVAHIKHLVADLGITLTVDTFDLLRPGIVLAVGCAVLAAIAFAWLGLLLLDIFKSRKSSSATSSAPISTRTLNLQWQTLAFMTIWILACNIPVTYIAVTRSAKTIAYLGTVRLPQAAVDARQRQLGVNPAYWSNDYVRLQVLPPWVTLLFSLLATVVSFLASKRKGSTVSDENQRISSEPEHADATSPTDPEKSTEVKHETV